jgi:hypothetical protein
MRAGDLVRFRQCTFHGDPKQYTDWRIGLLLEYEPYMKIAKIIFEGQTYKIRANDVQIHKQAKRR